MGLPAVLRSLWQQWEGTAVLVPRGSSSPYLPLHVNPTTFHRLSFSETLPAPPPARSTFELSMCLKTSRDSRAYFSKASSLALQFMCSPVERTSVIVHVINALRLLNRVVFLQHQDDIVTLCIYLTQDICSSILCTVVAWMLTSKMWFDFY